ncbi:hypothetical protein AYY18_08860 [Morganella psychrotolerans]|uniref:Adhesin n=2 Tax=Morganella psychrotolerans TaxID=368603 RepID=A0A1B8H7X5_9GAMM|nr:hypothetical protein AYY18_08860 [Morganella psychrotolerans]
MKTKKLFRFTFPVNNKNLSAVAGISLLMISTTCFSAYTIRPGSQVQIPVNVTQQNRNYQGGLGTTDAAIWGAIIPVGESMKCAKLNGYSFGWSSDNKIYGLVLADDVILGFTGTGYNSPYAYYGNGSTIYGSWSVNASTGKTTYSDAAKACNQNGWGGYAVGTMNIDGSGTARVNGNLIAYAGPKAGPGSYPVSLILVTGDFQNKNTQVFNNTIIVDKPLRNCTVSTDNTITFQPVDVSDAQNSQALANKTGNLTVNCDDTSNTPVTVEIQGPKGRYSDAMALTMKDGSDAPAEVRGFIGTDIPLTGQCNGRLDGYPGIVYFIPNAGMEKMQLTPGVNKYNWVLCSKGQNKTGQATGSAKLILNWD